MNKINKIGVAMTAVAFSVLAMTGTAFAAAGPLDGVTTEVNSAKSSLLAFINSTGVQLVFGLLILGVGIALATKFLRRAARSA